MTAIPITADDTSILASFKRGDQQAFRLIHKRCHDAVTLFAGRLYSPAYKEDAVQDVFSALWERRESLDFESITKVRNWLIIVMRNNYYKYALTASRQKEQAKVLHQYYSEEERTVDQEAFMAILLGRLDEAIKNLSPQEKKAINLYLQDVPTEDAAPKLGISKNSAGNLKRKAFDRLKEELKKLRLLFLSIYYSIFTRTALRHKLRAVHRA